MEKSIFTENDFEPTNELLAEAIGQTYFYWVDIYNFVLDRYPEGVQEWNYPGKKYGWSYRIKDKKRTIIYFLPRDGFFKVAFVFGQKAFSNIMECNISKYIKDELSGAKKYTEGRGIRIDVKDEKVIKDIQKLIEIKLNN